MNHFLDFEVGSFDPASFPVGIAWIGEDGCGGECLIRPTDIWLANGCPGWSAESERVHGISRERLMTCGVPAANVARMAAEALLAEGGVVCSDGPGMDGDWLATLLTVHGSDTIVDVRDVRETHGAACRPLLVLLGRLNDLTREWMAHPERKTWTTSPITVLDRTARVIRTHSAQVHRLRDRDDDEINPGLLRHLAHALRA